MNDLEEVAALLAKPEPSAAAVARSRDRLRQRSMTPLRRPTRARPGWFVPGVALLATGAAAAVVFATGAHTNGEPATGRQVTAQGTHRATGSEILLIAAVSAGRTPQGSGKYWHVTISWSNKDIPPMQSWSSRDGKRWTKGEPGDPPDAVMANGNPLSLKGARVTFEELEKLPTDPEALKAWIVQRQGNKNDMLESEIKGNPTVTLLSLITALPTPAEVRSAAFRALAATPGVENKGAVDGGHQLRFPDPDGGKKDIVLVIDPDTAQVTRANLIMGGDGSAGGTGVNEDKLISVTTEWTDQLPPATKD